MTSTFFCYGVEVFQAPMTEHLVMGEDGPEYWSARRSSRWRGRLRSPVAGVQTFWERITVGPTYVRNVRVADPYEVNVPVALRIDFVAGLVWITHHLPFDLVDGTAWKVVDKLLNGQAAACISCEFPVRKRGAALMASVALNSQTSAAPLYSRHGKYAFRLRLETDDQFRARHGELAGAFIADEKCFCLR